MQSHNFLETEFKIKVTSAPWADATAVDDLRYLLNDSRNVLLIPIFESEELGPFSRWVDERSGGLVSSTRKDMATINYVLLRDVANIKEDGTVWLLVVNVGPKGDFDAQRFCELSGSALEAAANIGGGRLVFPLLDLEPENDNPYWCPLSAATLKCRLAVLLRNRANTGSLESVVLVQSRSALEAVETGLKLNGPLCLTCSSPRLSAFPGCPRKW